MFWNWSRGNLTPWNSSGKAVIARYAISVAKGNVQIDEERYRINEHLQRNHEVLFRQCLGGGIGLLALRMNRPVLGLVAYLSGFASKYNRRKVFIDP